MSDTKKDMSDLFRSLRADAPSTSPSPIGASTTAEQRWPILKSFQPKKLAVTSLITEDEKKVRRSIDPATVRLTQSSPTKNSVSQELARGLNRMLVQKPVGAPPEKPPEKPSVSPLSNLFRKQEDAFPQVEEAEYSPHHSDDSLRAVLLRLEQAHQPPPVASSKQPAFLARLGKR